MEEYLLLFNRIAGEALQACNAQTCKSMTAGCQWSFLCACHEKPTNCIPVDYVAHNLAAAEAEYWSTLPHIQLKDIIGSSVVHLGSQTPMREAVRTRSSPAAPMKLHARRLYRIICHMWHDHATHRSLLERHMLSIRKFVLDCSENQWLSEAQLQILPTVFLPAVPA